MPSNSPYISDPITRYRQGDILRDVTIVQWAEVVEDGGIQIAERNFRYCVVLSQECDLEHDYNNHNVAEKREKNSDKFLQSLLICPGYPAAEVKLGEHLKDISMVMQRISTDEFKRIKNNNSYRYHYMPEHTECQVPELILDFKHYFTVPREVAYRPEFKGNFIAALNDLFREHLSSRFAHYLSRIGLPEIEST